jgi:hypothetical protein
MQVFETSSKDSGVHMTIPANAATFEFNPDFWRYVVSVVLKIALDLVPSHLRSFPDKFPDEPAPRGLAALNHGGFIQRRNVAYPCHGNLRISHPPFILAAHVAPLFASECEGDHTIDSNIASSRGYAAASALLRFHPLQIMRGSQIPKGGSTIPKQGTPHRFHCVLHVWYRKNAHIHS